MNLKQFVANDNLRNQWITERGMRIYVRRSIRLLDRSNPRNPIAIPCLDLASVEIDDAAKRGKGMFTAFLDIFEATAKEMGRAVYIESIADDRFRQFFVKRGYKFVVGTDNSTMYKIMT